MKKTGCGMVPLQSDEPVRIFCACDNCIFQPDPYTSHEWREMCGQRLMRMEVDDDRLNTKTI